MTLSAIVDCAQCAIMVSDAALTIREGYMRWPRHIIAPFPEIRTPNKTRSLPGTKQFFFSETEVLLWAGSESAARRSVTRGIDAFENDFDDPYRLIFGSTQRPGDALAVTNYSSGKFEFYHEGFLSRRLFGYQGYFAGKGANAFTHETFESKSLEKISGEGNALLDAFAVAAQIICPLIARELTDSTFQELDTGYWYELSLADKSRIRRIPYAVQICEKDDDEFARLVTSSLIFYGNANSPTFMRLPSALLTGHRVGKEVTVGGLDEVEDMGIAMGSLRTLDVNAPIVDEFNFEGELYNLFDWYPQFWINVIFENGSDTIAIMTTKPIVNWPIIRSGLRAQISTMPINNILDGSVAEYLRSEGVKGFKF